MFPHLTGLAAFFHKISKVYKTARWDMPMTTPENGYNTVELLVPFGLYCVWMEGRTFEALWIYSGTPLWLCGKHSMWCRWMHKYADKFCFLFSIFKSVILFIFWCAVWDLIDKQFDMQLFFREREKGIFFFTMRTQSVTSEVLVGARHSDKEMCMLCTNSYAVRYWIAFALNSGTGSRTKKASVSCPPKPKKVLVWSSRVQN